MANLATTFAGVKSPNPFWLASAPPTDKAYNVNRAFEAGWGGVVWKTLGEDPPIVNVNGPRYGALHSNDRRVIGFNNIELITDRPLATNLAEIRQIKRDWPDRALIVSVMLPMNEQSWAKYVPMIEDTGADGLELNFGCPHGMSERGMGSAVGQVPEYIQQAAAWAKQFARVPVIVKLTPNITNILPAAIAAKAEVQPPGDMPPARSRIRPTSTSPAVSSSVVVPEIRTGARIWYSRSTLPARTVAIRRGTSRVSRSWSSSIEQESSTRNRMSTGGPCGARIRSTCSVASSAGGLDSGRTESSVSPRP